MRLLKAVHITAHKATFQEKRTLLRLLAVQVLYDGDSIEMTGGVPTESIDLGKLLMNEATHEISSPQPQSSTSAGFRLEAAGNSNSSYRNSMDCRRD